MASYRPILFVDNVGPKFSRRQRIAHPVSMPTAASVLPLPREICRRRSSTQRLHCGLMSAGRAPAIQLLSDRQLLAETNTAMLLNTER